MSKIIVNGEPIEGNSLTFDEEGLKIGDGKKSKLVLENNPDAFDFAEEVEVTDEDFVDPPVKPKVEIDKKKIGKIALGVALGCIATAVVVGLMNRKEK